MKHLSLIIITVLIFSLLIISCATTPPPPEPEPEPEPEPPPPVTYKVLILIDIRSNENFRPIEGINVDVHLLDKDLGKVKSLFLQTDVTGIAQDTVRLYEEKDPHRANISVHGPGFRGYFETVEDIYSFGEIVKRIIYLVPEK